MSHTKGRVIQPDPNKRPCLVVDGDEQVPSMRRDGDPEMGRWMEGAALYQDAEATVPVTEIGQRVGCIILDGDALVRNAVKAGQLTHRQSSGSK